MEYLYETHMHTSEVSRCAVSSAAQQVAAYKRRGYTGIIVTDHFLNGNTTCPGQLPWEKKMKHFVRGYDAARNAGDKHGLDVFFGWEFTIRGADFLTYGLDLDFLITNHDITWLDIDEYSELVRENGGYLAQAHPFRNEYYIEHNYPVLPHLIDGVEVYNAIDRKMANERALAFAELNDLPIQAGTDSHSTGNSIYSGIILREKAETIHDIIKAIKIKDLKLI